MYKKTLLIIASILLIDGCSEIGEQLKTAVLDGVKAGFSNASTGEKNRITKEEYINKCIQKYSEGENDNHIKKLCKKLPNLDLVGRCTMELSIMGKVSSAFDALPVCQDGTYNTHFLDDSKKPKIETVNSCMEDNKVRYPNSDIQLYNYCVRKINRQNSKYIN